MALIILVIILIVYARLIFTFLIWPLLLGVWVVLRCIVATIRNEVENRRMDKEWREGQRANRNQ